MNKKEPFLKDGKNLLFYDPGEVDPKSGKRLFYGHIHPRSLREEIENAIPKVKEILEGTMGKAFMYIDDFPADIPIEAHSQIKIPLDTKKRTRSPQSIIGFRAKDASKEPMEIIAGNLAEKFSTLKFNLEKEEGMRRAVRHVYNKRLSLKCCSRARKIMEPKIQLARRWLEEYKIEYLITKTVWETYVVIKTFCREKRKNNCSDAFAYKIVYNLCGVFGIKRPSGPETLQRRIDRLLRNVSKAPEYKEVDTKPTGAGSVGPNGEYYPPAHIMRAIRSNGNAGDKIFRFLCKKIRLRDYALIDIL